MTRESVIAEERAIMNGYASMYRTSIESAGFVYQTERADFGRWMLERLESTGANPRDLRVLDLGCGTGESLEVLIEAGCRWAVGLDMAEQMLRETRLHVPEANCVQGRIEDVPFAANSFDVIVASFTLHHLFDPADLFGLIERCLRPGGCFFVLEYGDQVAAYFPDQPARSWTNRAGSVLRTLFRWKNRRRLAGLHDAEIGFNSAHQPRSWREILDDIPPGRFALTHRQRGALLPALKRVLVRESRVDQLLVNAVQRLDAGLAPRRGGYFQWINGIHIEPTGAESDTRQSAGPEPRAPSGGSTPPNAD
jgi:ubiquinone/menaquinone biosynthesis C-methylase UbiE